jgi:hypothetical protein
MKLSKENEKETKLTGAVNNIIKETLTKNLTNEYENDPEL